MNILDVYDLTPREMQSLIKVRRRNHIENTELSRIATQIAIYNAVTGKNLKVFDKEKNIEELMKDIEELEALRKEES